MKLQIPNQIEREGLTEGDAMLIGIVYLIANRHGWENWYNMNCGDFRKIAFPESAAMPLLFGPRTEKMREHLDFAQLDAYNILIRFKRVRPQYNSGIASNSVGGHFYELKDLRSIKIWCYLMGLWHGKNPIVSEADTYIKHDSNRRSAENLEYKNFLVG